MKHFVVSLLFVMSAAACGPTDPEPGSDSSNTNTCDNTCVDSCSADCFADAQCVRDCRSHCGC